MTGEARTRADTTRRDVFNQWSKRVQTPTPAPKRARNRRQGNEKNRPASAESRPARPARPAHARYRERLRAALRAEAERADFGRAAAAAPPLRPPSLYTLRRSDRPRPEPDFSPPP